MDEPVTCKYAQYQWCHGDCGSNNGLWLDERANSLQEQSHTYKDIHLDYDQLFLVYILSDCSKSNVNILTCLYKNSILDMFEYLRALNIVFELHH